MIALIPIINELQTEFSQKLPLEADQEQRLNKKLSLEFNFNSNHIEGNTFTYAETEFLLYSHEVAGPHSLREIQEMKASELAYELVKTEAKSENSALTEKFLKELNKVLLVEPYFKDATTSSGDRIKKKVIIGQYKKESNYVELENGKIHIYDSPNDTPIKMGELVSWINSVDLATTHPVEIAAKAHHEFVKIHPFDDGNGRVARLLMNYILIKYNYLPVVIKSADKANYLRSIRAADAGLEERFIEYIGQQLIWSLELGIKAGNGENLDEDGDWKKRLQIVKKEISDRDSVQVVKSVDTISAILSKTIKNGFARILEELSPFSDLFLNKSFLITNPKTGAATSLSANLPNEVIEKQFYDNINLVLRFAEFTKDPDNPFTVEAVFPIAFLKHKYDIYYDNKIILKKLYHQQFTDKDISLITNIAGERITTLIEDQLNK